MLGNKLSTTCMKKENMPFYVILLKTTRLKVTHDFETYEPLKTLAENLRKYFSFIRRFCHLGTKFVPGFKYVSREILCQL